MPRGCGTPGACVVNFSLNTNELGMAELNQWLSSHPNDRSWYQVLTTTSATLPPLQALRASGNVNVTRLLARNLTLSHVSAEVDLDRGKLKLSNLRSDFLGGTHRGDWQADFTGPTPVYTGSGTLTNVSLDQAADTMHDAWISGKAAGTYQFTTSGTGLTTLWQSAAGEFHIDLHDAVLPHLSLTNDGNPLRIAHWKTVALLRNQKVELQKSKLETPLENYEVSGSVSSGQALNLQLIGGATKPPEPSTTYSITGTLAEPHVTINPASETQAQLKP